MDRNNLDKIESSKRFSMNRWFYLALWSSHDLVDQHHVDHRVEDIDFVGIARHRCYLDCHLAVVDCHYLRQNFGFLFDFVDGLLELDYVLLSLPFYSEPFWWWFHRLLVFEVFLYEYQFMWRWLFQEDLHTFFRFCTTLIILSVFTSTRNQDR